ncbi:Hypothetical predicted protein [Mytilus galloprovincialis]|uniref:Uncharacterized protein n=1 Tax=Mytilus galloprovincialis TaxID=29158 RepID=A0A8B6GIL5_MYTGA|nr:Hypothetical predicted protein [Mytilus galloprovincialis]
MVLCGTLHPYCMLRYFAPEARCLSVIANLSPGSAAISRRTSLWAFEGSVQRTADPPAKSIEWETEDTKEDTIDDSPISLWEEVNKLRARLYHLEAMLIAHVCEWKC